MKKLQLIASSALFVMATSTAMAQSAFDKAHTASFKENGIAKMDRLDRDETQIFCSSLATISGKGDPKKREAIEKANMAPATIPCAAASSYPVVPLI